jgi:lipopolysaccharide biosynthesis glycosyltransferase
MIHNIVFATDQNYIRHLSVALISLLSTNKGLNFKIHIINGGIEKEAWQKLKQIIAGYKAELLDICIDDSIFEKLTTNHHFTKANYYRLLIPEFIAADKVLYLDADIVVNDSIEELYNTDLEDYYVGAVESPGFTGHAALKMAKNSKYFNSGVMLINNCKWRKKSLCNKVVNFVDKNEPAIQFVDQCGLNGVVN